MRHSHTTKQLKAKCLSYRNGKRCGRVAKIVGTYKSRTGTHTIPMCAECARQKDATIIQTTKNGFHVQSRTLSGWTSRTYREIE